MCKLVVTLGLIRRPFCLRLRPEVLQVSDNNTDTKILQYETISESGSRCGCRSDDDFGQCLCGRWTKKNRNRPGVCRVNVNGRSPEAFCGFALRHVHPFQHAYLSMKTGLTRMPLLNFSIPGNLIAASGPRLPNQLA